MKYNSGCGLCLMEEEPCGTFICQVDLLYQAWWEFKYEIKKTIKENLGWYWLLDELGIRCRHNYVSDDLNQYATCSKCGHEVMLPPQHFNCRCMVEVIIHDEEEAAAP
ncbi:MAG: hypothetical protein ACXQTL_05525 [Methanosarcinales archaeon]